MRSILGRPALSRFPAALQPRDSRGLRCAPPLLGVTRRPEPPAQGIGRTVGLGGVFIHVAGGVCLHASSLFFCLFGVYPNGSKLFGRVGNAA